VARSYKYLPDQLGLFKPESDWTPPTELPDLRNRDVIALDTENDDQGLSSRLGPGWALGPLGRLAGVSWAAEGSYGYAPVSHPETSGQFDRDQVIRWYNDHVDAGVKFVFANAGYDLGWLGSYGGKTPEEGKIEDVLCAEFMLDENQYEYGLDAVCRRRDVPGKDVALLMEAVRAYGGNPKHPSAFIAKLPAKYAGPYAEQDARATLELWKKLEPLLHADQVWNAYQLEMDITPMTVAMRRRGVRVNMANIPATTAHFRRVRDRFLSEIHRQLSSATRAVTMEDVRSPDWLQKVFRTEGVPFPKTEASRGTDKERGSFQKEWMERHSHWLPKLVTRAIQFEDAASKFVETYVAGFAHRGRIHAEVNQFLSEAGGTRTQRYSYSNPPLQQSPNPDKDIQDENKKYIEEFRIGKRFRQLFLPEEGELWASADYSQQEPRITVHYAAAMNCRGVEDALERYRNDPRTDYHTMVADMTGLPRPRAKILNLGMTYGKGFKSTAEELGVSDEEAKEIIKEYHARLPYIKALENEAKNLAARRGYIKLIDGARIRYPSWEGPYLDFDTKRAAIRAGHRLTPCTLEEAHRRQQMEDHPWHGQKLRRADTRKALNNVVQGSAARQTKIAGRAMWREGILPLLQMHDEWANSVSDPKRGERIREIMRDAVKLRVPVIVDLEYGPTWGDAKYSWEEAVKTVA
jgi:DNA polymerase I-like protein with 3'-5' exonuclease and polymerase domains